MEARQQEEMVVGVDLITRRSGRRRNGVNGESSNGSMVEEETKAEEVDFEDQNRNGAECRNEEHDYNTPSNPDTPMVDESLVNLKQKASTIVYYPPPVIPDQFHDSIGTSSEGEASVVMKDVREVTIGENEHGVFSVLEEDSLEVQQLGELDLERVLEKQESYDLFCPDCSSCVTKRVILRRRKRKIQNISSTVDEVVKSDQGLNDPPLKSDDDDSSENRLSMENGRKERRPDTLNCVSFFCPGTFWMFGEKRIKDSIQNPPQHSESSASADTKIRPTGPTQDAGINLEENEVQDELLPDQSAQASKLQDGTPDYQSNYSDTEAQKPEEDTMLLQVQEPQSIQTDVNENLTSQDEGLKPAIHLIDDSVVDNKPELEIDADKLDIGKPEDIAGNNFQIPSPEEPDQQGISEKEPGPDDLPLETAALPTHEKALQQEGPEPDDLPSELPEEPDDSPPETAALLQTKPAEVAALPKDIKAYKAPGPDILKAIVYGGLDESIKSLSVVTSAIGSDATTSSILTMGAANVIGGLFTLAHNLRALKKEASVERYEEQLGRVGYFPFHATIAVISYLFFGLTPAVVYCFSFRESNNRDLKLIALASSTLLCIFVLAIAKAHSQKPRSYLKTVIYYVSLGIMVSGAPLVAGDLIQALQEKLGLFVSEYSVTLPAQELHQAVTVPAPAPAAPPPPPPPPVLKFHQGRGS